MNETESPPPPISRETDASLLWHFTSLERLPKVLLEEPYLTAGHAAFMSDQEDTALARRARSLIIDLVKVLIAASNFKDKTSASVYESSRKSMQNGSIAPTFVLCFTESIDEPKMWMNYTKNGGVAIGFDKEQLTSLLKQNGAEIQKCTYQGYEESEELVDSVEKQVREADKEVKSGRVSEYNEEEFLNWFQPTRSLIRKLSSILVFQKRPAFSWERETRFAFTLLDDDNYNLVRFIEGRPRLSFNGGSSIKDFVRAIKISPFGEVDKTRVVATLVAKKINLSLDRVSDVKIV